MLKVGRQLAPFIPEAVPLFYQRSPESETKLLDFAVFECSETIVAVFSAVG